MRSKLALLVSILAVLLVGVPSIGSAPSSAKGPNLAPVVRPIRGDTQTTINGNFSVHATEPTAAGIAGSNLRVEFYFSCLNGTGSAGALLYIPPTIATFSLAYGQVHLYHSPLELNVSGPLSRSPMTNMTIVIPASGSFNESAPAFFSSQLASVMANGTYGSVILSVSWRWLLAFPDGTTISGPWVTSGMIQPAQYANLVSVSPTTVSAGSSIQVCLAGPIGGRIFSLHLETASPYDDFTQVNASATSGTTKPLCWSATVPGWVLPQVILAHVWDYDRVTLLLYIVKIIVQNSSSTLLQYYSQVGGGAGAVTIVSLCVGSAAVAIAGINLWMKRHKGPGTRELSK